jgi:2-dehydro-3-deoxyphosphogluconate aldolase/(4S)-4-hydroxy-2-oxoglutarate aldolase
MNLQEFQQLPVLGILRGGDKEIMPALAETLVAAGLKTVEITMNTPQAVGMIRQMVRSADGRLTVGAGTVLTREDAKAACDAGATFIVSPVLIGEVADFCVNQAIPFFPGALTPQEIYQAWHAGAAMVKVFPAKFFGPDYFREIKGPFEDVAPGLRRGDSGNPVCLFREWGVGGRFWRQCFSPGAVESIGALPNRRGRQALDSGSPFYFE